MKTFLLKMVMAAGLFAVVHGANAADADFTLPPDTTKLKAGAGSELVLMHCQLCHSLDYIATQPRLSRTAWTATLGKMQQKYGAPVPNDKVQALADYLTKNYGKE